MLAISQPRHRAGQFYRPLFLNGLPSFPTTACPSTLTPVQSGKGHGRPFPPFSTPGDIRTGVGRLAFSIFDLGWAGAGDLPAPHPGAVAGKSAGIPSPMPLDKVIHNRHLALHFAFVFVFSWELSGFQERHRFELSCEVTASVAKQRSRKPKRASEA